MTNVIEFKGKTDSVLPYEPEHIFTMEVYQEEDGGYTYEVSVEEDFDDDELIAAILYRASNTMMPFEVELELEVEPANDQD